jgi:methylated-DNA-[protein]-cysteine S-methyltransferase
MNTNDLKRLGSRADAERRSRVAAETLADVAAAEHLLDVAVAEVTSPIGDLLIAVTPRGLARVAFPEEDRDRVLEAIAALLSPRILESARATDEWRRELDEYFAGVRRRFDLRVDRRLIRGIARDVLAATARVPFGDTATYGEIAERIGNPRAARAVGNALGANPIPVVIPCHRVLRAGGSIGGYGGGPDRKRALLTLEGALPGAERDLGHGFSGPHLLR